METNIPAIGHVTKENDAYHGELRTLAFRAPIDILPNTAKKGGKQPDFRVFSKATEIGAGWIKRAKSSGEDYVSLSLADPAFGPKKLYANLGPAADQDDPLVFAVLWNPTN